MRLNDTYSGSTFFDKWDFFTGDDPTHGFVDYVDRTTSESLGLISVDPASQKVIIGIDSKTLVPPTARGRKSVRIESKEFYGSGLFVLDLDHIPGGCGTWPSFWFLGDQSQPWPEFGEFDVIEGVNGQSFNQVAGHTREGCTFAANPLQKAKQQTSDCTSPGNNNLGCSSFMSDGSFGRPFNSASGGVYAMNWDTTGWKVWFFSRATVPVDLAAGTFNIGNLGEPDVFYAFSGGSCNPSFFQRMRMIINLTFCGGFASVPALFNDRDKCPGTCNDFVANTPDGLSEAFWSINSIKHFV